MSFAKLSPAALAIAALAVTTTSATARDNVQIAGSSTVLPYAAIVAEFFAENFDFAAPVVESGGTSSGFRRFCEGVGDNTIDVANASRPIKPTEVEACAANGVTDIIEVRFGYDGIVFASDIAGNSFAFTPSDWYLALAADLPVDGAMVANAHTTWAEVRADMPDQPVLAFIPGTRHGTREVFELNVLLQGCRDSGAMDAIMAINGGDEDAAEDTCMAVRTDGRAIDIDGDYTETLARIEADNHGVGVFGLSFYENNADRLQVATMSGVVPSTESIASGDYPVSRPLYFYIKAAHLDVIPGLQDFADFFVSDDVAGPYGPLAAYGLVADPELAEAQSNVMNRRVLGQ